MAGILWYSCTGSVKGSNITNSSGFYVTFSLQLQLGAALQLPMWGNALREHFVLLGFGISSLGFRVAASGLYRVPTFVCSGLTTLSKQNYGWASEGLQEATWKNHSHFMIYIYMSI